jgi:xylulokinase
VYGVLGDVNYDSLSRVNNFAPVNHTADNIRLGVLLCINGTGILYSWIKRTFANNSNYNQMNSLAASVPIGSEGLCILPFGNGAERMLQNSEIGSSIHGINFNTHGKAHLVRAVQEGIVFSFAYGMEIMQKMGMELNTIHAGHSNMFLSSVFRDALAGVSGSTIELYDTDGSIGAARASGIGTGVYADNNEAFSTLKKIMVVEPNSATEAEYKEAYEHWKSILKMYI